MKEIYSLGQLYLGYNPISNLEIISLLNIHSQSSHNYRHSDESVYVSKFQLKIYINLLQTVSHYWATDDRYTPSNGWPESLNL